MIKRDRPACVHCTALTCDADLTWCAWTHDQATGHQAAAAGCHLDSIPVPGPSREAAAHASAGEGLANDAAVGEQMLQAESVALKSMWVHIWTVLRWLHCRARIT